MIIRGIGMTGMKGPSPVLPSAPPSELSRLLNSEYMKQVDWYGEDCRVSCCNSVLPKLRELSIEHEVPTSLMIANLGWVIAFREPAVV